MITAPFITVIAPVLMLPFTHAVLSRMRFSDTERSPSILPEQRSSVELMFPFTVEFSLTETVPLALISPFKSETMMLTLSASIFPSIFERRITVPLVVIFPLKFPATSISPSDLSVPSNVVPGAR